MRKALSIASFAILIFGFLYIAFTVGRAFETGRLGDVARVPGQQYLKIVNEDRNQ